MGVELLLFGANPSSYRTKGLEREDVHVTYTPYKTPKNRIDGWC
jgi:hypothetical protein